VWVVDKDFAQTYIENDILVIQVIKVRSFLSAKQNLYCSQTLNEIILLRAIQKIQNALSIEVLFVLFKEFLYQGIVHAWANFLVEGTKVD
jgi:hypothetical protein